MLNMPEVLVLATSRRTHGGISSVVMAHEMADEWKSTDAGGLRHTVTDL